MREATFWREGECTIGPFGQVPVPGRYRSKKEVALKKRGPVFESVLLRPRLLAHAFDQPGLLEVEAPAGFGKTVLLHQMAQEADGLMVSADDDVAAVMEHLDQAPMESSLVAVDSASDRVECVLRMAEHPSVHTLVVADRYLAPEIQQLEEHYPYRRLTAHELRLSEEEMHELSELLAPVSGVHPPQDGPPDLAERVAYVLGPASEGWPLAAAWMLRRAFTSGDPLTTATELSYPGPDADAFMEQHLALLDDHLRHAIESLAHFDAFTGSCVDTLVGQGGAGLARRSGAPLLAGERGWYRLPRPISRPLRARRELDVATAELLAPVLIASGGILAGLRALMQAGCVEDARQSLVGLAPIRLDEVDQQGLIDIVAILRAQSDAPHLALVEARAHRRLGDHPMSDRCLDDCLEMGASGWVNDPANAEVILAARIDRLFGRAFSPSDETDREIAELRSQLRDDMAKSHELRLDEIDALLRAQSSDPAIVARACEDVMAVARRWESLGETVHAAVAIRRICSTGFSHLGRYSEAIEALKESHRLSWHRLRDRTLTLSLSCRFRVLAGETDSVRPSIRELDSLADAISHDWVKGYLNWTKMILASRSGEPDKVVAYAAAAERATGSLMDHETGVLFRSEAAIAFAEVGLLDEAEEQLAFVADRPNFEPIDFALASATVAARRGRRDETAMILTAIEASGQLPPARAWRGTLESSIAADLSGDGESAMRLRSAALAEAERHGQARLAAHLMQSAPTLGATPTPDAQLRVNVLGQFSVHRNGSQIDVPDGHVMVLLKLLAVSEVALHVDFVFDVLWPAAEPSLARRRIKNVVSRLRGLIGADQVIRTNETLELAPSVEVDLRRFNEHVRAAVGPESDCAKRVGHVRLALDLYQGPVLPTDLYDDWASDVRQSTDARTLTLLDMVFDLEPASRPSASWMLDILLRIDANDDTRLLRVTRQALAEGHHACARAALERALTAAQDLGVSLEEEIRDLRFLLKTA